MTKEMIPVTFKTPADIREWLQQRADENHRSVAGQINFILEKEKSAETPATA